MVQRLRLFQFFSELLRYWRQSLAPAADNGYFKSSDVDRVAVTLDSGFVGLPIMRFLGIDPVSALSRDPGLFHRLQSFCTTCEKQVDCSAIAIGGRSERSFDDYCPHARSIRDLLRAVR